MLPLQGIWIQVDTSHQEEELKKEEKAKKALRGAVSGRKEIFLHDLCLYSQTKAQPKRKWRGYQLSVYVRGTDMERLRKGQEELTKLA